MSNFNPNYNNQYWNQQRNYYQTQMPNQPTNVFAWVQGDAGASAFPVSPNVNAFLMDSDNPIIYMKSADATGRPSSIEKRYLITEQEYDQLQNFLHNQNGGGFVTKAELEDALKLLDEKYVTRKRGGKNDAK